MLPQLFATRLRIALLMAIAAAAFPRPMVSSASAAEPLTWKFEKGMTNRYRMDQTMDMHMDVGGNKVESSVKQKIDTSWTVLDIQSDGNAVLEQRIDRMRLTMNPAGTKIEVDSAAKEPPEGQAATLMPLLKAITSKPFTVTMTPRGETIDVKAPPETIEALKNSPGAAAMGDLASAEGFKKLVSQAAFVLPEKLEPDAKWTRKMEMNLPGVGKQIAATTYHYEGPKEVDGKQLEAFSATLELSYEGNVIRVTDQKSTGQVLFNREAGRLERSQLKQNMKMQITNGPQTVDQEMDQTVDMKWTPEKKE